MSGLASEGPTVQYPLVRYAGEVGWQIIPRDQAESRRRGEGGLFFYAELEDALVRLNSFLSMEEVRALVQQLEAIPASMEGNREMLEWLRGQRSVYVASEKRQRNVTLVDFGDSGRNEPGRNVFQVTYEWAYRNGPNKGNRADVVFLINGVPVAIVENKNPKDTRAMEKALVQLRRYELETPELLTSPQVYNITHLIEYFYGVTWNYQRKHVFNWREEQGGSYEHKIKTFFDHARFLRMLRDRILFFIKDDELQKTVLRQHQSRAVLKVVARCADPKKSRGLVWHTQGSGKTFTMITVCRLILEDKAAFPGATVMLVIDRNELEGQLSGLVERLLGEIRNTGIKVETADSKKRLQELLNQDFRGLILTMIQFDDIRKDSCTREDFFVLIDEAHRSTGGDLGNFLMGALPKATLIGFTGTPIDKTAYGKGTFKTFGNQDGEGYLDKYSIAESIADGTTVKLRHTLAPAKIRLPKELLEQEFLNIAEAEGISDIEALNKILERAVRLRAFLKSDERVEAVAQFVAQHFRENVEPLGYKAFLVAVDREACALYKKALDKHLPPDASVPVYTHNAADVIERPAVAELQLDEAGEKSARQLFVKPGKQPQILIVTDKLLTGYDAPVLYCMYLDKPMRDHVLLQAIARVNRPYENEKGVQKPCGLVVDFVGVLRELNKALAFDSKDVSGVIEDLDILLQRFVELMKGPARQYLDQGEGRLDKQLERLLYETLLDKQRREAFVDLYREIEALYEILSPSPELRDYIADYGKLADLYRMVHNAYGHKTGFYGDVAMKTELLVRQETSVYGTLATGRVVEYDVAALEALRKKPGSDEGKVLNLAIAMRPTDEQSKKQPYLIGIAERADAVLQQLEERRLSTDKALDALEKLMRERLEAQAEQNSLGMDVAEYSVFRTLRLEEIAESESLAKSIVATFRRYPNREHEDEARMLKAEIYKLLVGKIEAKRMAKLAEIILALGIA